MVKRLKKLYCDICGEEIEETHRFKGVLDYIGSETQVIPKCGSTFDFCPKCTKNLIKFIKILGKLIAAEPYYEFGRIITKNLKGDWHNTEESLCAVENYLDNLCKRELERMAKKRV